MRLAIAAPALIAALGLSAAAMAGSPDNPGAGGQAVQNAAHVTKEIGTNWGSIVSEYSKAGGNLGEAVQGAKEYDGGDPNPSNDNGGGNDVTP